MDAPSGTAKLILRQIDPEGLYAPVYGRSGRIGARGREIGVHAVRGGTAAGEHSLRFFGRMEELELRHRADSREIFAQGALRAAAFAQKAEPGLYDMEDVLFGGDGCDEIVRLIQTAEKKTPVKVYVRANRPLHFENCHVFTGADMIVMGDYGDIAAGFGAQRGCHRGHGDRVRPAEQRAAAAGCESPSARASNRARFSARG